MGTPLKIYLLLPTNSSNSSLTRLVYCHECCFLAYFFLVNSYIAYLIILSHVQSKPLVCWKKKKSKSHPSPMNDQYICSSPPSYMDKFFLSGGSPTCRPKSRTKFAPHVWYIQLTTSVFSSIAFFLLFQKPKA